MKKLLLLAAAAAFLPSFAEIVVWRDNPKKCYWIAADKKTAFTYKDGLLTTPAQSFFLGETLRNVNPGSDNLPGCKLKFSVEARGKGEVELGIWNYQPGVRPMWKKIALTDEFKPYSVEYTLDRKAPYIRCLIRGAGEFRNATLANMRKEGYVLKANPPYQMYANIPEKVTFTLYKDGVPVPDAALRIDGEFASDPDSGAVTKAYAQKGDTAAFDAAAKEIKLDKPVNVLYLGDSLTHFDEGFNHADKTVYFLNKFNPGKARLFNRAVRGDSCSITLDRMKGKYKDVYAGRFAGFRDHKYDIAFIFLGQNDTRAHVNVQYKAPVIPPERQKRYYTEIISILKKMGVPRIIIISCASLDEPRLKAQAMEIAKSRPTKHAIYGKPEFLEQFNAVSQKLAKELGVEYLDIYTPMKALPDKPSYFIDGCHLSRKGHDFVALETLKHLAKK